MLSFYEYNFEPVISKYQVRVGMYLKSVLKYIRRIDLEG
jgi:hypothetical protein